MSDRFNMVGVVVFRGDEVLLVRHGTNGTCNLPCGRIEVGENEILAGVRVLFVETGLVVDRRDLFPLVLTFQVDIHDDRGQFVASEMKVLATIAAIGETKEADEATTYFWVPQAALGECLLPTYVERAVGLARRIVYHEPVAKA